MLTVRVATDLAECQALWVRAFPQAQITDLWEVRACFLRHFHRRPFFVLAEDTDGLCGLLPLSWVDEADCFGYFPGETWGGRTWLEQNRILARRPGVFEAMIEACPAPYDIRYLLPLDGESPHDRPVDEIGYLFIPPQFGYDIEAYYASLGHGFAKKLRKELRRFEAMDLAWRHDELADFDHMVRLNIERFGDSSYFADARFTGSFRDLMHLFRARGWLRMTTALIGGEPAAVDMGVAYGGTYTLIAGGTHGDYKGVAKVINLHHIAWGCQQRFDQLDFLCGDFSWKPLFRLTPRPLYRITNPAVVPEHPEHSEAPEPASAL